MSFLTRLYLKSGGRCQQDNVMNMSFLTRLYLKEFLHSSIGYGVAAMLLDLVKLYPWDFWSLGTFFRSIFFGLVMSLIGVISCKRRLKKMGVRELTSDVLSPVQTRIIESSIKKEKLFEALKHDSWFGKMRAIETKTGINLISGISFNTWGENIKISVVKLKGGEFVYEIISMPRLKATWVDNGANLKNVRRIEELIKGCEDRTKAAEKS